MLLTAGLSVEVAAGQTADTVEIVAGREYSAGPLHQRILGRDYRDLWTMPVRVPVLDLAHFAGGLAPVERGGGEQTRSLRLLGNDGREYNFRSVNKWVSPDPRSDLENTLVEWVVQDQVSSLHPAATVVATGLLDAVGILHPDPRLVVLPDDARLGEFREEFAGMLGTIEIHANEADDGSWGFAGSVEVESEEDFFEALRESPDNRIDAPALLAERLMSILMGDWDRHAGQYRWARFDSTSVRRWIPVPEDRDYAFADYDGLFFRYGSSLTPKTAPFEAEYGSNILGLTLNSAQVDRLLLAELPWSVWERAVTRLQAELTDAVIEAAVRRMPAEYFRESGPELIRILRERRDRLADPARSFYLQLAAEPEVHGTDVPERADAVRLTDGSVRIRLAAADETAAPYFERTFVNGETEEIRLYMHGGDDRVLVSGEAEGGPLLRVVGGAGADTLLDVSAVRGRSVRTTFYDAEGENVIEPGTEALIDRTPYKEPLWVPGEIRPPRDWGKSTSWFVPWAAYENTQGVIIGGGPRWTWYGFRRAPFASRIQLRAMYGPRTGDLGADGVAEFLGVGSMPDVWIHGRASDLEDFRFHGFGNLSPEADAVAGEIVHLSQRLVEVRLRYRPGSGVILGIGPVFEHLDPNPDQAALDRLPTAARTAYGKVGLASRVELATRPDRRVGESGLRLRLEAEMFPEVWDLNGAFGRMRAEAVGYAPLPGRFLLAARAGGVQLWGDAPLLEHASLGGSATLRGFPYQRFTGDAVAYGGIELRTVLGRVRLFTRGDLGVLAFTDVGRAFIDGLSEGSWHTGRGGGVWFESLGTAVSATYARGEEHRVYLKVGLPF